MTNNLELDPTELHDPTAVPTPVDDLTNKHFENHVCWVCRAEHLRYRQDMGASMRSMTGGTAEKGLPWPTCGCGCDRPKPPSRELAGGPIPLVPVEPVPVVDAKILS